MCFFTTKLLLFFEKQSSKVVLGVNEEREAKRREIDLIKRAMLVKEGAPVRYDKQSFFKLHFDKRIKLPAMQQRTCHYGERNTTQPSQAFKCNV